MAVKKGTSVAAKTGSTRMVVAKGDLNQETPTRVFDLIDSPIGSSH
ncbi:hypothetical protein Poly41_21210 [Novipirellula artificiosorum]|uniref:Uncharacterized protein n=1 Tax=Novipirellula artificiosorum TaxID=2528016 RepID=A0A5C6DTS8_9BACT|nr:hypothetical protein Poly41_21210 [Novipirellula artificiosorum]